MNKDPEETEEQGESPAIQDPVGSQDGRDLLEPTEIQVSLVGQGFQVTVEMKDKLDQRAREDPEASKELQETEDLWARGEKMVLLVTELSGVMDTRAIVARKDCLESQELQARPGPKETMESQETPDWITLREDAQDREERKDTEVPRAQLALPDHLDLLDLMIVRSWTSS